MGKCNECNQSIEAAPATASCGCSVTSYSCGCGGYYSSCGCTPKKVSFCQEDNSVVEYVVQFVGSIINTQAFSMPECSGTVTVQFDNVCNIAIGTWVWAEGIGYLEVTGSSNAAKTVTLKNICPSGYDEQADPGTSIPVGNQFVLGTPLLTGTDSSNPNSSLYPYLNSGFLAPGDTEGSNCVNIAVTNVNGLAVNKNVAIGTGTYRLSAIISPTLITICNDGEGIAENTTVDYVDGLGNLTTPIVLIDNNPCTNDAALSGQVIVCDGSVLKPLEGTQNNQLLVWDNVSQKADFRSLGIPTIDCTALTADLILNPSNPSGTSYVIYVNDTSSFAASDIVLIGGSEFEIDSIIDGTSLTATPLVDPVVIQHYTPGSTLCGASCCELLDVRLTRIEKWVYDNDNDPGGAQVLDADLVSGDSTPITDPTAFSPLSPGTTIAGNLATALFNNNSGGRNMKAMIEVTMHVTVDISGTAGQYAAITFNLKGSGAVGTTPAATGLVYAVQKIYPIWGSSGVNRYSEIFKFTLQADINPTDQFTVAANVEAVLGEVTASNVQAILLNTNIVALGVAVA